MMRRFFAFVLLLCLLPVHSFAADAQVNVDASGVTITTIPLETLKKNDEPITFKKFIETAFTLLAEREQIPDTYKYIELKFKGVTKGSSLYIALQKGVYMNFIENSAIELPLAKKANEEMLAQLVKRISGDHLRYTKTRPISVNTVTNTLNALYTDDSITSDVFSKEAQYPLVQDVFSRIQSEYYDANKVSSENLMQGAIKGIAEATGDKYTVYFPPEESKSFQDSLAADFEGVGAYMDMITNGEAKVISVIADSPAQKAGIQSGDIIKKIDDYTVTDKDSINTVTAKIKGPAGTKVKLTILRGNNTLSFEVTRAKIALHYVEFQKLSPDTALIKISAFGAGVAVDFKNKVQQAIKETAGASKIVIDLRNNPGGSLDEVAAILSSFVPEGQDVVKVKYRSSQSSIAAAKTDLSLMDKKVAILINGGSASAAEIMAGTIKDYMPKTQIVGEKSFGKGSVQNFVPYTDGSSIKYTIAKWFTGKTATGIDGVGIKPDIEIVNATGSTQDMQLQKAIDTLSTY